MMIKFLLRVSLLIAAINLAIVSIVAGQDRITKIVFFGDSITELGEKPGGYISLLDELARKSGSPGRFEFIGAGVSGNKIYDLYLRVDSDVITKKPDAVVIFVGVNDIWHKGLLGTGTDYDKFGKFYSALTEKLGAAKIKIILCTPAVIGERTDFTNQFDGDLNLYSSWIRDFAARQKFPLVDLRKAFLDHDLSENKTNAASGILTTDKVHLSRKGNELVAAEMWKVISTL
jgi:lysophospholipase L1-like esterase